MSLDLYTISKDYHDITVFQGTSPWVIGDGGSSITVDAVALDIRALSFATDKVDVSGSSVSITGTVAVTQSTSPWVVSGTVEIGATSLAALESITVQNGAGGSAVNIQDGGNSITVDGTVELGATTLAALESITVQNGAGAAAVNIQDGGNSITVDGTVGTVASGYSSWKTTTDTAVTASAGGVQIFATPLTGRAKLFVQNVADKDIRLAESSSVSATRGILLKKGTSTEIELAAGANLYAIGIGGAGTVALAEYAA